MGLQFNDTRETVAERTESTNHEGGESYDPDSVEMALYKRTLNNLLEDNYYEDAQSQLDAMRDAFEDCAAENPEFVLKLAAYARQVEGLRQAPQVLLALAAANEDTKEYVAEYAPAIMDRADEPLTVLAAYTEFTGSTTLPRPLRNGIEAALHQYDEYEYAKWDRPSREWRYHDLLNLVHPTPQDDERDRIFEKIAYGNLDDYDVDALEEERTWETAKSDEDTDSEEAWRDSLEDMGLKARIMNVRNMLQDGITADEIFEDVTEDWVRNSKLWPFRFYQAYKAVEEATTRNVGFHGTERDFSDIDELEALLAEEYLEEMIEYSTANLPDWLDDTAALVDVSGSMDQPISGRSTLHCDEISTLFGALLYRRGSDVIPFATRTQAFNGSRRNTVLTQARQMRQMGLGGGTSGNEAMRLLREKGDDPSRVIIFTDMQMWDPRGFGSSVRDEWQAYKQENPDASLYIIDLANYGDLVTPEGAQDVYNISGWSTEVLEFIEKVEQAGQAIEEIEEFEV